MDLFDLDNLGESALDAFLTDPNIRELWLDKDKNNIELKSILDQRANKKIIPLKNTLPIKNAGNVNRGIECQLPLRITLSMDETKAWVELSPMLKDVPPKSIEELIYLGLEEDGIVFGIRKQQIARLSNNPIFGMPLLVAEGKMPQEDKEGAIQFKFDTKISIKPKNKEDYSVDVSNPGFVQVVRTGDLLCTSTKVTNDFTGTSVRGKKYSPKMEELTVSLREKTSKLVQTVADGMQLQMERYCTKIMFYRYSLCFQLKMLTKKAAIYFMMALFMSAVQFMKVVQ